MGKILEEATGLRQKKQGNSKYFCTDCFKSGKGNNPCGVPGHNILYVSHKIWFPSPKASKTRWKKFFEAIGRWYPFHSNDGLKEKILSKVPLK